MRIRKGIILISLELFFLSTAFAQYSPTRKSTGSLFLSDVDNFMNVLNYSSVEFDEFFIAAGYGVTKSSYLKTGDDSESSLMTLPSIGTAFNVNDYFLGVYYSGLLQNKTASNYINENYKSKIRAKNGSNQIDVLFGFNDELHNGIKLSVGKNQSSKETESGGASALSFSYQNQSEKNTSVDLNWGCNLRNETIFPTVGLKLEIGKIDNKNESYSVMESEIQNSKRIYIPVGLEYDFLVKEKSTTKAIFDYCFSKRTSLNQLSSASIDSKRKTKNNYHDITVAFGQDFLVSQNMEFRYRICDYMYMHKSCTTNTETNSEIENYKYNLNYPYVQAGIQYTLVPDLVRLNFGGIFSFLRTYYSDLKTSTYDSKVKTTSAASVKFYGGLAFDLKEGLGIDLGIFENNENGVIDISNITLCVTYRK